jgi:hypothetical protein
MSLLRADDTCVSTAEDEGITQMTETTVEQRLTYRIHESFMDRARELVAKVNKRAARLGLSGYELVITDRETRPIFRPTLFHHIDGTVHPEPIGYEDIFTVELVGRMPKINGWSFVAALDYTEGEGRTIVKTLPGVEMDLSAHRVRENECDHCGTKRMRNATYVLVNDNGETMQVGSTCMQPYMGLTVAGLGLLSGDAFAELGEHDPDEDDRERGPRIPERLSVDTVLLLTMVMEQLYGFVPASQADGFHKIATSEFVKTYLRGTDSDFNRAVERRADWEAARVKAAHVRTWAIAEDGNNSDWRVNIRILAEGETVTERNVGMLCSAVVGYNRTQADKVKASAKGNVDYVGKVGSKIAVIGTVERTYVYENSYSPYGGRSEIVIVRAEGALFKWNSSRVTGFEVGDKVEGTATVKAHQEYRGDRQTVITRAKLVKAS